MRSKQVDVCFESSSINQSINHSISSFRHHYHHYHHHDHHHHQYLFWRSKHNFSLLSHRAQLVDRSVAAAVVAAEPASREFLSSMHQSNLCGQHQDFQRCCSVCKFCLRIRSPLVGCNRSTYLADDFVLAFRRAWAHTVLMDIPAVRYCVLCSESTWV